MQSSHRRLGGPGGLPARLPPARLRVEGLQPACPHTRTKESWIRNRILLRACAINMLGLFSCPATSAFTHAQFRDAIVRLESRYFGPRQSRPRVSLHAGAAGVSHGAAVEPSLSLGCAMHPLPGDTPCSVPNKTLDWLRGTSQTLGLSSTCLPLALPGLSNRSTAPTLAAPLPSCARAPTVGACLIASVYLTGYSKMMTPGKAMAAEHVMLSWWAGPGPATTEVPRVPRVVSTDHGT